MYYFVCVRSLHVIYLSFVFLFSHLSSVLLVLLFALCAVWSLIYHVNSFPCPVSFSCHLPFVLVFAYFSLLLVLCVLILSFAVCSLYPFICPVCFLPFIFPRVFFVLLFALFVIFFVSTHYVLCPLHCVSIPCIYSMFFVLFLVFTLYVLCPSVCPVCPFLCLSTSYLPCVSVHRALIEPCAIKVDIIIIMCPLPCPDEDLCAGSVCQQTCSESSDGRSFTCSCQDGYLLNEDQRTCRGTFLLLLVMSVCQRKTDERTEECCCCCVFP